MNRDELLAQVSRALRECFPETAEDLIRECERYMPKPHSARHGSLHSYNTISDEHDDGVPRFPAALVHAIDTCLNEIESHRVSGTDYMTSLAVTPENVGGARVWRISIRSDPR